MADGGVFHTRALTSVADHDGILDEILARLPVKSLMRFRCVCKSWRALIADSYFSTKHFRYANRGITDNTSRLFFSMKDNGDCDSAIRKFDFPVMLPESTVNTIVGSCNGLICLQIDREEIVLWNPSTRDYKVLPKPTIHCTSDFYGFGYDSTTDESLTDYRPTGSRIISFDFGEEKFKEMLPLPCHACFSYIFCLGDCLSVYISGFLHNEITGFRIWMMKEYGVNDSWTEVVSSEDLPKEYEYSLILTPLCILENGEVLMVKTDNYQSLVLFSSKEQTFRNVVKTRNKWKLDGAIYRETLVSPDTSSVADI